MSWKSPGNLLGWICRQPVSSRSGCGGGGISSSRSCCCSSSSCRRVVVVVAMFCACLGRDEEKVKVFESYLKAVRLFRDYADVSQDPEYSEVVTMSQFFLAVSKP